MAHRDLESRRVCEHARNQVQDLNGFDYSASAELFVPHTKRGKGKFTYKRFDTAAEALRCAVEEIPARASAACILRSMRRASDRKKSNTCMQTLAIRCGALQRIKKQNGVEITCFSSTAMRAFRDHSFVNVSVMAAAG